MPHDDRRADAPAAALNSGGAASARVTAPHRAARPTRLARCTHAAAGREGAPRGRATAAHCRRLVGRAADLVSDAARCRSACAQPFRAPAPPRVRHAHCWGDQRPTRARDDRRHQGLRQRGADRCDRRAQPGRERRRADARSGRARGGRRADGGRVANVRVRACCTRLVTAPSRATAHGHRRRPGVTARHRQRRRGASVCR